MKNKIIKNIAIILLSIIIINAIIAVFVFGKYIISNYKNEKKYKLIESNFNKNQNDFKNLDIFNKYVYKNEYKNALTFIDSLIKNDTTNIDLILKRGMLNLKLNYTEKAKIDFKNVVHKTSNEFSGNKIINNDKKEEFYYAMIGLMLSKDTLDNLLLKYYDNDKKASYININLDKKKQRVSFNIDSVLTKQFYNMDYN